MRPIILNDDRVKIVAEAIRVGNTRKASAAAVGVTFETLRTWLITGKSDSLADPFVDSVHCRLYEAVELAEAECEMRYQSAIYRAAEGVDTAVVRETKRSSVRTYKVRDESGQMIEKVICTTITHSDGTIEEVPVEFTETTTETVRGREFDWRAGLEWLKRRRRDDYSDSTVLSGPGGKPIEISKVKMTDEQRAKRLDELHERARQRAAGSG
jgi:hypothetical protein